MNEKLESLPIEIQEEVRDILTCYPEVNVIFANSEYSVSTGFVVKKYYAHDERVVGNYRAKEIFTQEEQDLNFINNFYDYPRNYKGVIDYKMLKQAQIDKKQFVLVNGSYVIA